MIGMRCRPSSILFDEKETALAALAGIFAGIVSAQNPLDDIIHTLDGWIEDIVRKSGPREDVAAGSERVLSMPAGGPPTIAARAAAAGISPRTMLRHVRARTGLAPKRYASLQRFSQALRHLALDQAGFAQIAAEVGYSDQAHMTVDLARHAGVSPGRFRALARRQIRNDAVRFFKDADLRKRVRLLVCDSGAPIGAAGDTAKGQHGQ
jgi:AraC-like DNA-binding protein